VKLNLPAVLMVFIGVLLIYSAYKDEDPRNVIFEALNIKRRVTKPEAKPKDNGKVGVPDKGYNNVPHNGQGYPLNYVPGTTVVSV
jgi:hypothetical protein